MVHICGGIGLYRPTLRMRAQACKHMHGAQVHVDRGACCVRAGPSHGVLLPGPAASHAQARARWHKESMLALPDFVTHRLHVPYLTQDPSLFGPRHVAQTHTQSPECGCMAFVTVSARSTFPP